MFDLLPGLAMLGLAITTLSAMGTKVLHEFSRHDLELYCRRRNTQHLFDEILDRHENVAIAAETLQLGGGVLAILCLGEWLLLGKGSPHLYAAHLLGAAAVVAAIFLLLTTWIPWAVVRVWSAPFLYHTWPFWTAVAWAMWPLTMGGNLVVTAAHRLAGREDTEEAEEEAFEDEIRTIVTAGLRDGLLEADAREMIEGIIELDEVDVGDIMTPRSEVDALNVEASWPEMLKIVADSGRTRMPVYEESLDNVLGILIVKDLLAELSKVPDMPRSHVRNLLRPPWFIPASKRVDELLREFRRTRGHMAIVVDEYRAVAGVVTIEDALEEIVGEIADESDTEEELELIRTGEKAFELDGRVHIDEVNEQYGLNLPEPEEFGTIAGFVVNAVGRIPNVGEVVYENGMRFTVLKATPRRVERLRLEILEEPEAV
ncbi:MAG: hemolysin family protein [Planctomycetota bacterium]